MRQRISIIITKCPSGGRLDELSWPQLALVMFSRWLHQHVSKLNCNTDTDTIQSSLDDLDSKLMKLNNVVLPFVLDALRNLQLARECFTGSKEPP